MGVRYNYICADCDFTALIAGGVSDGFIATTETYGCKTCGRLFDKTVNADSKTDEKLICYNCRCELIKWNDGDPCIKCGGNLERKEIGILWD
jgi:hypothetical protein